MSANNQKWYFRKGELAVGTWDVYLDANKPPVAGWAHTGLRIGTLKIGTSLTLPADNNERIIFPLEGDNLSVQYTVDGKTHTQVLRGRTSVFHGPSDVLYLSINTSVVITGAGRVAVGECPAKNVKQPKFIALEDVPVGVRGAGRESRQVHNFGMPEVLDADRMIVCEVIVPAGNWSGSPSHKHDTYVAGKESNLEEIY